MSEDHEPGYPRTVHLNIADLNFNISSRDLPISTGYDTSYKQFLTAQNKPSEDIIDISLHPKKDMPDITNLTKIFETPESWYMLSNTTGRYIVFQSPDKAGMAPEWAARIESNLQHIDVFSDKKRLAATSNEQVMDNPVRYPLDQILLINCLLGKGLLIHAAGIIVEGKGCLFAGPSGAGKSTICKIFQEITEYPILSDDRMVIRKSGPNFLMYGTPWAGEAGIAVNDCAELHGIFYLKKSDKNAIKQLSPQDTLDRFFKVSSLPMYDKNDMQKSIDFCEDLLKEINVYELNFRPGSEIIDEIRKFISD